MRIGAPLLELARLQGPSDFDSKGVLLHAKVYVERRSFQLNFCKHERSANAGSAGSRCAAEAQKSKTLC